MAGPGINNRNSHAANNFHLVIDGTLSKAYVRKVSGGSTKRKVVKHQLGATNEQPGALSGKLEVEPITLECSMALGKELIEWCNEAFRLNPQYRSGAILQANQRLAVTREIRFYDAMIKKVTIPALDAGGQDNLYLTIEIQPTYCEYVEHDTPQEGAIGQVDQGGSKARAFNACDFVFELQGMGDDAGQVVKCDSFSWEAKLAKDAVSDPRAKYPDWRMCGFEQPQLKLTYNAALNSYFNEFYQQFVKEGVNNEAAHRWATITFFNLADEEQAEIRLDRLGVAGGPGCSLDASSSDIARNSVDLYFSMIQFNNMTGFDE